MVSSPWMSTKPIFSWPWKALTLLAVVDCSEVIALWLFYRNAHRIGQELEANSKELCTRRLRCSFFSSILFSCLYCRCCLLTLPSLVFNQLKYSKFMYDLSHFDLHSTVCSVMLLHKNSENVNFSKFAAPQTPYWW